jgi:hypothetical protein
MNRRDTRAILLLMRKQWCERHCAEATAAAAASSTPAVASKRPATETLADAGAVAAAAMATTVPVEQRLVELDCSEIFHACMRYV